jgi:hypothetical protein
MTRPRPALFVMLAVFLSAAALAVAAPSLAWCKWCGSSFTSLTQLLASPCSRSPSRKHEPYEGVARQFTCANTAPLNPAVLSNLS